MNKHYKTLELDKILHMLAEETSCADAYDKALETTPVFGLFEVQEQLNQTNDAHMLIGRFGTPSFGGVKNTVNALRRAASGGCLTTLELLRISETLRIIRSVKEWRSKSAGVETSLDLLFQNLVPNKFLEEKITSSILSEEEIADAASPTLSDIRRKMRTAASKAREILDKMIHSSTYQKYLQDAIVTQRGGRYVVPVKAECRGSVPGLVHDTSSSGATVFIEPMGVVQANNDIKVLKSKEEAEIERILFDLSANAGSFADSIIESYNYLVEINLIFAKANLGYKMKAVMPQLNNKGIVEINKARHPLIDKDKVVATDIRLAKDFSTLVITGPNTGGKTVTLKTLGLLTLMAMCGLLVPAADNSKLSVFSQVLVDIGDEQSIEQSLSTFSSHMTNIVEILKTANSGSLVLIDELGAGTDPVEGAALAIAILEQLRKQGAKIASTTHYAELKAYAIQTPGVENGSCEFDVATLQPTYKLLIGVPGKSNAFAISKRLGMEDYLIERAKVLVSAESRRFEDVVETLETRRQDLEVRIQEAQHLTQQALAEKEQAQQTLRQVREQSGHEIEKAQEEAQRIIAKAKAQAYSLMDELEKAEKAKRLSPEEKAKLRQNIRKMEDAADPVKNVQQQNYVLPRPLKAGDDVLIYDIDKKATVLETPGSSNSVFVQAGIIKTRVDIKNLRLLDEPQKQKNSIGSSRRSIPSKVDMKAVTEIDVRGQSAMEAVMEVDSAIDHAILSNINQITVIHGKGTGVLRKEIHAHLKKHKAVKNFRLGVFGEGETGVTILELK